MSDSHSAVPRRPATRIEPIFSRPRQARKEPTQAPVTDPGPGQDQAHAAESLVGRLRNLHDGPLAFREVVRLGERAIPALEGLVRGPSDSIYHSRCLATDALAAIGTPEAVRALTRALHDSIAREPPPASMEAESVLVNHIAEHLSRFEDPDVTEVLLAALRRRCYPYCAAALGLTRDSRAIPLLIECLYEDAARPVAMGALRGFGRVTLAPLARALLEPRMIAAIEPPTRVDGRAGAAKLLGELAGTDELAHAVALQALTQALNDRQRAVRVEAALALARCGAPAGEDAAVILVVALDDPDWARAEAITEALVRIGSAAERVLVSILGVSPRDEADRRRRLRAVTTAGRLGSAAAVTRLRSFAKSSEVNLRLAAITALGQIAAVDAGSLALFLTDREPRVRQRALQALRRRDALTADSATRLLADADCDVRRLATASVRENIGIALPALKRAAYRFGAPLHGWAPRWRLWWHACALIAGAPSGSRRTSP